MMEKEFLRWVLGSYTNCGPEGLMKRYPKTTQEMKECFTIDEVYNEYKKNGGEFPPPLI